MSPAPETVEIHRDAYGVPHVYASSDLGAAYGVGYACAQDRFTQMTYHRLAMRGRLAEFLGRGPGDAYLNHDSKMRIVGYAVWAQRIVDALEAAPSSSPEREAFEMLEAYAAGVNDYAASGPTLTALHADVGFPAAGASGEDWTPADSVLLWMRLSRLFTRGTLTSLNGMVRAKHDYETWSTETNFSAKAAQASKLFPKRVFDPEGASVPSFPISDPLVTATDPVAAQAWFDALACPPSPLSAPAPGGAAPQPGGGNAPGSFYGNIGHVLDGTTAEVNDAPHLLGRFDGEGGEDGLSFEGKKFSEAFAISYDGKAHLYGGPKIKVFEPNEMWEVHFVGASFDVRGATIPGSMNVLVGSNRDAGSDASVAWTVTSAGASQGDVAELTVHPSFPDQYRYDGVWIPMTTSNETVEVLGESPVTVVYRETPDWGPVLTRGIGDTFLLEDCEPDEEHALRWMPFTQLGQDPTVGFLAMYRSVDAGGFRSSLEDWTYPGANCVFADDAGRIGYTLVGDFPVRGCGIPLAGMVALDGSSSSNQWLDVVPQDHLPWVIKESLSSEVRYVASANNSPVDDTFPIPLVSHGGQTERHRRLLELLDAITPTEFASTFYLEHLGEDGVLVGVRDLVRLALHLRDVHGLIQGADAHTALIDLDNWADPGLNAGELSRQGKVTSAVGLPSKSALALYTRAPFRSHLQGGPVPEALILKYGAGDMGLNQVLRELIAVLDLPGEPCVGTTCKQLARFVNLALRTGLEKVVDKSGNPFVWDLFYLSADDQKTGTLTREVATWTGLEQFEDSQTWPALDDSPPSVYGPMNVASGYTLYNQGAQTYLQFVTLEAGTISVSSMLPPGQAEDPASPHSHDQVDLWHVAHDEEQVHKSVPLDIGAVGDSSPTVLGYVAP